VRPTAVTNRLRALRADAGLTQAQLAAVLGVTRQTVIAVEQGRYSPSLELAFQIARALERPIDQVFSYEPDGGA
jgi:putative transcriptional regulator